MDHVLDILPSQEMDYFQHLTQPRHVNGKMVGNSVTLGVVHPGSATLPILGFVAVPASGFTEIWRWGAVNPIGARSHARSSMGIRISRPY